MTDPRFNTALIVGAGSGLSASLARVLTQEGVRVAIAAMVLAGLGCNLLAQPVAAQSLTDRFKSLFGDKSDEPAQTAPGAGGAENVDQSGLHVVVPLAPKRDWKGLAWSVRVGRDHAGPNLGLMRRSRKPAEFAGVQRGSPGRGSRSRRAPPGRPGSRRSP